VDVKVLLVSPYPPKRDGIAAYSAQVAADLRREGNRVEVVSPEASAAHHHTDYRTLRGVIRLITLSYRADRTVVQFYPELFFPSMRRTKFLRQWPLVASFFGLGRRVELVVHEAPYEALQRAPGVRGRVARALWRSLVTLPSAALVHTEWERQELARTLGLPPSRIGLLEHGGSFMKHTRLEGAQARRELGLDEKAYCFLCIGFLQQHKGFDRAVRAFNLVPGGHLRLDIVGSARVPAGEIEAYVTELRDLARTSPRVTLHERFVSDEQFDRWLSACDVVVLPYRTIWSSGVLARAGLFDKPVIVTDVGGLPEQAGPKATVVHDDLELARAMAELAGVHVEAPEAGAEAELAEGVEPGSYEEAVARVHQRARLLRSRYEPEAALPHSAMPDSPAERLPHFVLPQPEAATALGRLIKRVVFRLTHWQLAPQVRQLNEMRGYLEHVPTTTAALEARVADQESRLSQLGAVVDGAKHATNQQMDELRGALAWLQHLRGEDRAELTSQLAYLRTLPVPDARSAADDPASGAIEGPASGAVEGHGHRDLSALYEAHQGRFRGSRESVRRRQEIYLPYVAAVAAEGSPVVDLGPGRGEWLELLKEHGIRAYGVDTNASFVAAAAAAGLDVCHEDGVDHLRRAPDGSLSAITAFHVAEHIPFDALLDLVEHGLRALRPGGLLILETPNPLNVLVGASWFHLDPTHIRPIHPEFLAFLLENRGFVDVRVETMHPPDDPPLEVPAAGEGGRDTLRRVAELLNRTFYTGMDYAVIGQRASPVERAPTAVSPQDEGLPAPGSRQQDRSTHVLPGDGQ
jgi:glycosyltransferase involved in cell wall biosynthesis/SAM-dependent methyltransferase